MRASNEGKDLGRMGCRIAGHRTGTKIGPERTGPAAEGEREKKNELKSQRSRGVRSGKGREKNIDRTGRVGSGQWAEVRLAPRRGRLVGNRSPSLPRLSLPGAKKGWVGG